MGKILLLFILSISAAKSEKLELRDQVLSILPKEISTLNSRDSFEEVRARFKDKLVGRQDKRTLFLGYFEKDNDVTIGFVNGKFSYAYVKLSAGGDKVFFERAMNSMTQKQKNELLEKIKNSGGHSFGKDFEIELPEQALRLKFKNDEEKKLRSVVFWDKGAKAP